MNNRPAQYVNPIDCSQYVGCHPAYPDCQVVEESFVGVCQREQGHAFPPAVPSHPPLPLQPPLSPPPSPVAPSPPVGGLVPVVSVDANAAESGLPLVQGSHAASHMVDGDLQTSWECTWDAAFSEATAAVITLTLGEPTHVHRLVIRYGGGTWSWLAAVPKEVRLAVDGGAEFVALTSQPMEVKRVDQLAVDTVVQSKLTLRMWGRYVRTFAIREVELYSPPPTTATPSLPPSTMPSAPPTVSPLPPPSPLPSPPPFTSPTSPSPPATCTLDEDLTDARCRCSFVWADSSSEPSGTTLTCT